MQTDLTKNALLALRNNLESVPASTLSFNIPHPSRGHTLLTRRKPVVMGALRHVLSRGLYEQSLVVLITIVDGYLSDILITVLRRYPEKMGAEKKQLALAEVLRSDSLEALLTSVIELHVKKLLHDTPRRYLQDVEELLGITLPADLKEQYIEFNGSRDLIIHAGGRVDKQYLQRVGSYARAREGEEITVDPHYFQAACRSAQGLVKAVHSQVTLKYRHRPTTA